jgi:serine/threonine protein kinase
MAGIAPQIPGCRDLSLIGERVARSLFSATSDRLGRPVTVIAYPPLSEGRTEADFDRAAATAQRLGVHPSMISIHEWGHADDHRPWIITDPQPADALDTLLKQDGPLEIERALQMGVLLAGALETAHAAGIVHGDLSPARVVVGPHGEPLMTETGLAPFAVFPGLGALNNPVRYHASPEVLEGTELTPATDVYSLATTVYALIAGRAPQEKPADITDSNASLLLRVLQMAVPPIERRGLPPGLLEALRGPLAPDPRKRPRQAIEVAWLLQDVQRRAGFPITEPVVLDLDDIEHHRSRRAGSYPAPAPAPKLAADPAPAWGTWSGPIDVEGPATPAPPAPRAPRWSPPPIPDRAGAAEPPATIFPLAAGGDDVEAPPAPKDTLWPSSWPAGEPEQDLPAWARQPASPPANRDAPPRPPDATAATSARDATDATHLAQPADLPPWAQPSANPPTTGDGGPAELGGPSQDAPADLPAWAQPSAEPTPPLASIEPALPSLDAIADLPPWSKPSSEPSPPTAEQPADLPVWAKLSSEPSPPTPEQPADLPPWAKPSSEPSPPTPEQPADLPPWAKLITEPGAPSQDQSADLPPWAQPTESRTPGGDAAEPSGPAHEPPADLPPWGQLINPPAASSEPRTALPPWDQPAQPSAPAPGITADRPELPRRSAAAETPPAAAERPALPKRQSVSEGERPAWAQAPPAPRWAQGGGTESEEKKAEEKKAEEGNTVGLPGWARARPGGGEGNGTDEGEPPWLPGVATTSSFAVARPPELDVLPAWYTDPLPLGGNGYSNGHAGAGISERLPGAGDELRSLFGAVVGDPPPPPPPPPLPPPLPPMPAAKAPPSPAPPSPPSAPAPAGKAAPVRAAGGVEKPLRLPRPPLEPEPQRVPRADPGRQAYPPPETPRSTRTATRPPRDGSEPAAPAVPTPGAGDGAAPQTGPAALPVIVLVVVLAVLVLAILWLVITGDDSGPPADEPPPEAAELAPAGLTVTPGPEGDQLAWQGDAGASYVVTVLSPTEPPQALPAAAGTSALVPNAGTAAPGQRCYTVAVAPGDTGGVPGPASEPACPPGVSPASMLPAA